jgi:succinate dehydrogenase / fumarate reductase, iron-sulfur subunit
MMINGIAHGPDKLITACQLHMRSFRDGDEIWIEPWRARSFPVMKDLVVDRSSFDRIVQAGGYISVRTGSAPDANALPIPKPDADRAFDAAACIGCGACVAACPNASAMLFTAAKAAHLSYLPQGQPERLERALGMAAQHDDEGFGNCTNHGACQEACPKGISVDYISRLNRDVLRGSLRGVGLETASKA